MNTPGRNAVTPGQTPTSGQVQQAPAAKTHTVPAPLNAFAAAKPERTRVARILSSRLALAAFVVILIGGYATYSIATSHDVAVANLKVGDCFNAPTGLDTPSGTSGITGVQPIACTQAHDSQIFAKVKILESTFPGAAALQDEAQADCEDTTRQSAVSSQAPVGIGAFNLFPQDASSFASQDYILCAIQYPSQTLTQSYVNPTEPGN